MRFFVVLLFCLLAFPLPSFAAPPTCSVVSEGVIVYNKDHKVMQYCDGVNWIGMSGSAAQSIDTLGELECDTGEIAKYDGTAWTCSEDTGGLAALQGTNDPGPCTVAKDGLIKYNASGSPKWHYCDGGTTSWLPFRLPQCLNDDAGECTLAALRNSNDPQFKPSSIRCGDKLLGVTGTYGSGSSNAFTYTDVTGANLSMVTTSAAVTIGGIASGCPGEVSVAGTGSPQISINGGAWGAGGSITNGQTLAVRLTSSASFGTANTAIVSIGTTDSIWSVTTLAADTTPAAFDFTPNVTNAALSTLTTASNVTITGINTSTPVSVTGAGAQISINGGAWGTSGNITSGQTLGLRLTSSAAFNTAITATVNVGGVTDTWSVTTLAADTTPDAFNFTPDVTGAALSTVTTASSVTIAGINTSTPVSVSGAGAEISINGGAWGTSGNITSGQTLAVRLTSSAAFSTAMTATVNVGGVTDSWSVETLAADTTPTAFDFTPNVTGAALNTLTTATAVTITGINTSTPISVTGAGATISIAGGAWVTSGSIVNGQTLAVRLTSSAAFSTAMTATVDVGGVTDTWSVTTRAAANCTVTSGTTWTATSQTCTAPADVAINHGATGTSTDATAPTTGSKIFSCTDGTLDTSGTPTCSSAPVCSGATWTARTAPGARSWDDIQVSPNGLYQLATEYKSTGGGSSATGWVQVSHDGGASWPYGLTRGNGVYHGAISSTGQIMVTVNDEPGDDGGQDGAKMYRSTDYGVTWPAFTTNMATNQWRSVAGNTDLTRMIAVAFANDRVFFTTNSGTTWTQSNAPALSWYDVATSDNGMVAVAAGANTDVYRSVDGGATWVATGAGTAQYRGAAMSSDGTIAYVTRSPGYIFKSIDSGVTWAQLTNSGSRTWQEVATSDDGQTVIAGNYGGYIYVSTDAGATWVEQTAAGALNWNGVAVSANGTMMSAVASDNYIYNRVCQ